MDFDPRMESVSSRRCSYACPDFTFAFDVFEEGTLEADIKLLERDSFSKRMRA